MQITIFVEAESLQELSAFLRAEIKYEHTIEYYIDQKIGGTPFNQVLISYDDYVELEEWCMQSTEHPYFPKESRTKE